MIQKAALVLLAVLPAACTTGPTPPQSAAQTQPSELSRLDYSLSPCRGTCPSYVFSIAADGAASFNGERHTKTAGRVSLQANPDLFRKLETALAAARPAQGDRAISAENCQAYYTDQQVVTVQWIGTSSRQLSFDLGCGDAAVADIRSALSAARRLMPIDAHVGRSTEF